ncbi:MAG TPA: hypothetical protein VK872_11385, partial [Draconibacterium sp.]|nr:hypothetical protein [Draconibacterium sp.]
IRLCAYPKIAFLRKLQIDIPIKNINPNHSLFLDIFFKISEVVIFHFIPNTVCSHPKVAISKL